jgi:hypothetical protein
MGAYWCWTSLKPDLGYMSGILNEAFEMPQWLITILHVYEWMFAGTQVKSYPIWIINIVNNKYELRCLAVWYRTIDHSVWSYAVVFVSALLQLTGTQ